MAMGFSHTAEREILDLLLNSPQPREGKRRKLFLLVLFFFFYHCFLNLLVPNVQYDILGNGSTSQSAGNLLNPFSFHLNYLPMKYHVRETCKVIYKGEEEKLLQVVTENAKSKRKLSWLSRNGE
jgi:hypothetical protein